MITLMSCRLWACIVCRVSFFFVKVGGVSFVIFQPFHSGRCKKMDEKFYIEFFRQEIVAEMKELTFMS